MKLLKILLETYKEEYELNLKEGLIRTTNIGKTLNLLKAVFDSKIEYQRNSNTFEATFNQVDKNILNGFLKYANNLGWFPSYITTLSYRGKWDEKLYNSELSKIRFEAKFDEEVIEKTPPELFHITPTQNAKKILQIGLVPKSRSKAAYHPERVYLGRSIEDVERLASRMYQETGYTNFSILKVDTTFIPGSYFRLYKDPNYKDKGYFTLNNIPPTAIKKIKDINL
jgi:hypothetical protein